MSDKGLLAKASFNEDEKVCDLTARKFFNVVKVDRWLTFTAVAVLLYIALYSVASRFNWEHDTKLISDHYYQVLYLIILGTFIYSLGNFNNTFSYWFILGMVIGGFGIAILGQLPGFNFSFGSLASITGVPLITTLGIVAAVSYLAYLTWKKYKACNMQQMFWVFLGVPIALIVIAFILARVDSASVEIHLHHWQWALALVFFARYPGIPLQSFLAGLFVGIVIDGISRYGPDPLFEPIP